ncbi:MAG: DEAD/DEAH box helicase [Acidimicrobiales bacterium]
MQLEWTFLSADPVRESCFVVWDPADPGGMFARTGDPTLLAAAAGEPIDVELVLPALRGTKVAQIAGRRVTVSDALDHLAAVGVSDKTTSSELGWSAVVRSALGLIARGRLLPWVSPDGWDTWRVDPLDSDDLRRVEQLAAALPAAAHCTASTTGSGRIVDPVWAVRQMYDAAADTLVRSPAAAMCAASPVFVDRDRMRVRHLHHWVRDVAAPHCVSADVVLQVRPPFKDREEWRVQFKLRSRKDPSLIVDASQLWASPAEVRARFGDDVEVELLAGLRRAAELCPCLTPALSDSGRFSMTLSDEGLDELIDHLDALAAVGVSLQWPADLVSADIERRIVVDAQPPKSDLPSVGALDGLLQVNWEFLLDGLALDVSELAVLANAKRGVVPLRGRWVRIDRRDRRRLAADPPKLTTADAIAASLGSGFVIPDDGLAGDGGEPVPIVLRGAVSDLAFRILSIDPDREEFEPDGFEAELRPYQRRGLAWMADLCDVGLGGCLADDMGLGKTIQLLALHVRNQGKTLIVCPTSLLTNWEREAKKFAPGVRVVRYHGPNRRLPELAPGDLVITSYGVVRSDAEALGKLGWDLVVADEAQYAKNPKSRTAKALRQIPSRSRMALTGTPVENRLLELWSILDWAVPGLLGGMEAFRRNMAVPIEREGDAEKTDLLRRLVRPFLLRRRKIDPGIAPELPPKTELDVLVAMTEEQVTLYRATTDEALAGLKEQGGFGRHALVLRLLTSLKQITNHPAQFLGEPGPMAGRSGKLDALEELLGLADAAGESTLVFTQYVQMGQLLVGHMKSRGAVVEMLHGGLSVNQRQRLVDSFQAGELPVLVLSLKAAGTGLNLTRATQVIHYDRWWNPAVEDQATDRAYRIGQDQPVTVHRLLTEGTVEDRVAELLNQKRQLADQVVGGGESWISKLDQDDLERLVCLDGAVGDAKPDDGEAPDG